MNTSPNGSQNNGLQFSMVAGEASGDMLAGLLLKGMRQYWPAFQAGGIGGGQMQAHGFNCWTTYEDLAVHGYVDALKNYRKLSALRQKTGDRIIVERPAAFIGVDAPDFNLGLEKRVRQAGIKAIHFVSPSIWAWRGWRIKTIAKSTDLVLCLFPFEPSIYEKAGIQARYVGHPLADEIPLKIDQKQARDKLGLQNVSDAVIAIMPGSRRSEMRQLGAVFLATAKELLKHRPNLRFVFPVAPGLMPMAKPLIDACGIAQHITVLESRAGDALAACDIALIASGTATLEAALYKRPMVIAYKVGCISGFIFRRMAYLPWIGLPNILCKETVVPEHVQGSVNPQELSQDVLRWLDAPTKMEALQRRFAELHQLLRCHTAQAATHAIAELLDC